MAEEPEEPEEEQEVAEIPEMPMPEKPVPLCFRGIELLAAGLPVDHESCSLEDWERYGYADPRIPVKVGALESIGSFNEPRVEKIAGDAITHPKKFVRIAGIGVLSNVAGIRAVSEITEIIEADKSDHVVMAAANVLRFIDDDGYLRPMRERFREEGSVEVRNTLARAMITQCRRTLSDVNIGEMTAGGGINEPRFQECEKVVKVLDAGGYDAIIGELQKRLDRVRFVAGFEMEEPVGPSG